MEGPPFSRDGTVSPRGVPEEVPAQARAPDVGVEGGPALAVAGPRPLGPRRGRLCVKVPLEGQGGPAPAGGRPEVERETAPAPETPDPGPLEGDVLTLTGRVSVEDDVVGRGPDVAAPGDGPVTGAAGTDGGGGGGEVGVVDTLVDRPPEGGTERSLREAVSVGSGSVVEGRCNVEEGSLGSSLRTDQVEG